MYTVISSCTSVLSASAEKKARDEKNKVESETSNFVGEVGKRIVISNIDTITAVTTWYNEYGSTTRYKIADKSGNIYMWDSSTGIYLDAQLDGTYREVVSITGTIKKHDEFRGVKQTWITRCKVAYSDPINEKEFHKKHEGSNVYTVIEEFLNYCNA